MTDITNLDHLFRHQYGKMVSILTRVFGIEHLETIEDAVQDTFISAIRTWPSNYPDNPEGWLLKASRNRTLDLFRKKSVQQKHSPDLSERNISIPLNDVFLETEVEDSQLRMIFTACNPALDIKDQIAFALKTIAGFSEKEIASSLLIKEETIKKRLQRARKTIKEKSIQFSIPTGEELPTRLKRVQEVIYLIFNEGFHSNKKDILIREDLCGEATRLAKLLLTNPYTATSASYALFALFCFHSARLRSKTNEDNEVISLKEQDRNDWYWPLIKLGHQVMNKAVETDEYSQYHYEAAIASEHLKAKSYEETNWEKLLMWYKRLYKINPSPLNKMNIAIIQLHLENFDLAKKILDEINQEELEQRKYLYYGLLAEYYLKLNDLNLALENIDLAIELVRNESEKKYLQKRRDSIK